MAHLTRNSEKEYPCPRCGTLGNIIREGADPRLKCNDARCSFLYEGSVSLAAKEAGEIPEGPPAVAEEEPIREVPTATGTGPSDKVQYSQVARLPRTLSFVVVAKDRFGYEFCTKKTLKRIIFEWETAGKKYDVFELTPKSVTANVIVE